LDINDVTGAVVDSSYRVHSALGPGLLESAYVACLAHELIDRGLLVRTQVALPVHYRGIRLDVGYRMDLVVAGLVVVEIKAVSALGAIHEAQMLSYLKLSGFELGLLINFNEIHLRDGICRMALSRAGSR
jgi:GxxExxY protein